MRDRKGFTLIELLIVVVIIGILAAIAIPKFSATREKAFVSAMKSDLRNFANQQELYYSNHYVYGASTELLQVFPSARVSFDAIVASATGYSGVVSHDGVTGITCSVFFGTEIGPTVETWQEAGVVACVGDPAPVAAGP